MLHLRYFFPLGGISQLLHLRHTGPHFLKIQPKHTSIWDCSWGQLKSPVSSSSLFFLKFIMVLFFRRRRKLGNVCHITGAAAWCGSNRKGGLHLCASERWMPFNVYKSGKFEEIHFIQHNNKYLQLSLMDWMNPSGVCVSNYPIILWEVVIQVCQIKKAYQCNKSSNSPCSPSCWFAGPLGSSEDCINQPLACRLLSPCPLSHLSVIAWLPNRLFLLWGTPVVLLRW